MLFRSLNLGGDWVAVAADFDAQGAVVVNAGAYDADLSALSSGSFTVNVGSGSTVVGSTRSDVLNSYGDGVTLTGGLGADVFYVEGWGNGGQPRTVTITDLGNGTDVLRVVAPNWGYYYSYPSGSPVTVNATLTGAWVASSDTYATRGVSYYGATDLRVNLSTAG